MKFIFYYTLTTVFRCLQTNYIAMHVCSVAGSLIGKSQGVDAKYVQSERYKTIQFGKKLTSYTLTYIATMECSISNL